jgi:alkanesulfonate monooxygenase
MPSFIWTLPTRGDARRRAPQQWNRGDWQPANRTVFDPSITDVRGDRFGSFEHAAQIVRAADVSGFDGITIPDDPEGDDAWVLASSALRASRYLQVIPEFSAGFATPVYAAKIATTLQRSSGGRLGWRIAVEADEATARRRGDPVSGDDRYRRAAEFVQAARLVLAGPGVDFEGDFYQVDGGGFAGPLGGQRFPEVYTSGTSDAALAFAAQHADAHVLAGAGCAVIASQISALHAHTVDREVRIAVTLPVIVREDSAEAYAKAQRLLGLAGHEGRARDLATAGSGWVGFDRIGLGQRYGLVGGFDEIADRLGSLADVGVDTFILDTPGRLEGAYLLGEELIPRLLPTEVLA